MFHSSFLNPVTSVPKNKSIDQPNDMLQVLNIHLLNLLICSERGTAQSNKARNRTGACVRGANGSSVTLRVQQMDKHTHTLTRMHTDCGGEINSSLGGTNRHRR